VYVISYGEKKIAQSVDESNEHNEVEIFIEIKSILALISFNNLRDYFLTEIFTK
jgi:hypothetical protein